MPLLTLRVIAALALILLLWNPASSRLLPAGDQPIVLLDASLSMTGAPWRAALDSARSFIRRRALVWRGAHARFQHRAAVGERLDTVNRVAAALRRKANCDGDAIRGGRPGARRHGSQITFG